MHAFVRLVKTLLVRPHRPSSVGMKSGTSGSKDDPSPIASADTRSIAVPERRLRSEFIALVKGLDNERIPATMSGAKSHPPLLQRVVRCEMPSAMTFQVSSVSLRVTFFRATANSAVRAADELHCGTINSGEACTVLVVTIPLEWTSKAYVVVIQTTRRSAFRFPILLYFSNTIPHHFSN